MHYREGTRIAFCFSDKSKGKSPVERRGEVLELLRRQERQCGGRVPGAVGQAAWPCSLMGGEVICKE